MRPLAVPALVGLLVFANLAAAPSPARALAPAVFDPVPPGFIGISTKVITRILEFVDWAVEDLRAQVDRRQRWDPPPPVIAPLASVASGGTTTAPAGTAAARRGSAGMIP